MSFITHPGPRLQALEHAAFLLGAAYLARQAWSLGASGAIKAIGGAAVSGLSVLPGSGALLDAAISGELANLEKVGVFSEQPLDPAPCCIQRARRSYCPVR